MAVALATIVVAAGGCTAPTSGDPSPSATLLVLAAASLRNPLQDLASAFRSASNVALTVSTDSSAALRVQIEEGAAADVFLSADLTNPDALVRGGLTSGVPSVFARNGLAIVVPAGNPAGLETPWDLGRPGLRVVAAGESVPITGYAERLLEALDGLHGGGTALRDAYRANVVSREDNVGAVLAKVELGEGDAGIVYLTDAVASDRVESLPLPDDVQVDVAYAGVIVAASRQQPVAQAFLEWLRGSDAQSILARYGFRPVG